ncbi:YicC family protein [Limnobacter humi]|uniref:YicC family protein n=1 Tax=Limnobacter humi TaxID=1778671 RepID=A0ABT1WIL8_9BURK|nr:YicC/YloC family endoribonuclease [Limnobacter humi]MCQ8897343.1 YicC family protein [Limnobacter humi]
MSKPSKNTASIHSMTGFANVQKTTRAGTLSMELRSVNSRFLDLNFRMPDDLRLCEPLVREKLMASLSRGKVECRISWGRAEGEKRIPQVDLGQVQMLAELESSIQSVLPRANGFRITEILNWPGVVEDNSLQGDELQETVNQLCDEAIDALKATREREGVQLAAVLNEKIDGMEAVLNTLLPQLPEFLAHYESKIRERMTEMLNKVVQDRASHLTVQDLEDRIKQEVALHSVRIDVKEEMDRLNTHFTEVRRILKQGGVVGKRLDFVTQELNREANTLGSKAHAIAQTQASIDLKVLVEQFREQVQNIE